MKKQYPTRSTHKDGDSHLNHGQHSPLTQSLRVLLYDIVLPQTSRATIETRKLESHQLVHTYGGSVLADIIQRRHHYSTWGFIGHHKLQDLIRQAYDQDANLILINQALKPRQIHNLEQALGDYRATHHLPKKIRIWDRVDLIISIFSKHAHTAEARMQLELARIEHFGPRIYGMGEDLSQQGGGIGTRGLGETNTEIMKRHLAHSKKLIRKKLENLAKTRQAHRNRRSKNGFKTIALIGYTNTGKSALFKALSGKAVHIKDELFATLHTLTARIFIHHHQIPPLIVSDTIGFIEDLPPKLLEAFRSTLEDTLEADMLLHVIDISDHQFPKKIKIVQNILKELHADTIPTLMVFNKLDKLKPNDPLHDPEAQAILSDTHSLFISAKTGHNIDRLKNTLVHFFTPQSEPPPALTPITTPISTLSSTSPRPQPLVPAPPEPPASPEPPEPPASPKPPEPPASPLQPIPVALPATKTRAQPISQPIPSSTA